MRLASISTHAGARSAAVEGEEVVDLHSVDESIPINLADVLAGGEGMLARVTSAVSSGAGRTPLSDVRLAAPIPQPQKFFAVGLNYADHVAESGIEVPAFPTVFAKMPSCIVGAYDDIVRPIVSDKLDYEGELGIVIGRRCRHVSREDARDVIAGYVVMNDVSVRDYQGRTSQWTLGKSFDTHGVVGPWIVTGDEVDPHNLDIRTFVNGEERQSSNTRELIFDCFDQIELLSTVCTLEPGDLIATGTPGGVGNAARPPRFLVPGDVVRVEIDGIGSIENRVVQEPSPSKIVGEAMAAA